MSCTVAETKGEIISQQCLSGSQLSALSSWYATRFLSKGNASYLRQLIICIAFRILHNGSVCLCCFCVWCWIRKFCPETPLRVELYLLFLQFPGYGKELPSRPREYRLTRRVRHELFRFRMDHWVPSLCVYPSLRLLTEQLTNREYRSSLLLFGSPRPTSSGHSSSLKS